jgi:hypothetical protein
MVSILWFEVLKWVNGRRKRGAVQVH